MESIPVLVVSGFLGSGKTTLVRHLLDEAQAEGARVAFISNELGELGVDQALLAGQEERFVELAGGCVCCQLNDELYETLIAIKAEVNPDRIVIETSGVAIPHDVQIALYQPPVEDWVSEEAVVVVVNAEQVVEERDLSGTFTEQLESADLVLLNKVDLVSPDQAQAAEQRVAPLNPGVPVLHSVQGKVDPRLLFGRAISGRTLAHHDHDHDHEQFEAREVAVESGLSVEEVLAVLAPHKGLRIKGFVDLANGPHIVQGVGRRVEVVAAANPVEPRLLGRVVVIRRVS